MQITINIGDLLEGQEQRELASYIREVVRCRRELLALVPGLNDMNEVDMENLLVTDQPGLADQIRPLLTTITQEWQELDIILDRIAQELVERLPSLVMSTVGKEESIEVPVDVAAVEGKLGKVLSRIPVPMPQR